MCMKAASMVQTGSGFSGTTEARAGIEAQGVASRPRQNWESGEVH